MLQVRDLTKRYTTKGETVEALDHVSLDFPETGMVFLLGRSGSGKSTLLNLAGGLDVPDEGEIVVKGKSSKDFTGSDFDSYRNTYVGFIFQEYNILNELTVGENVALALELQGKPRDKARIDELLSMVDMQGYADRRPNTLSGGQKQRVAIARALVKEPEIIMADEPTGALDSATGAQVFDTLKKLSREKLVVVVSHDRDFAETYGDRIIELKDGKVISDVTRSGEVKEAKNVVEAGPKRLTVASGAAMSREDEERVIAFLRANKGSIVLSAEKEDAAEERRVAGTFSPTDAHPRPLEENTASFLPSRFPARYAFKMGIAGLRIKPLRLIVTTLLAAIAFLVFGVFSTMITYSPRQMGISGLSDSPYGAAVLQKKLIAHGTGKDGEETVSVMPSGTAVCNFVEEDVAALREESGIAFIPVYNYGAANLSLSASHGHPDADVYHYSNYYYSINVLSGFADVSYFPETGFSLLAGEYPSDPSEGLISLAVFEGFRNFGYRPEPSADSEAVNSYEDIIGKAVSVTYMTRQYTFRVVGVFDAGEDFSAYDALKGNELETEEKNELTAALKEHFLCSMSSVVFVSDEFYERYGGGYSDQVIRSYHSLMSEISYSGKTTAYREESESMRRYQLLMAPLGTERSARANALFAYYGRTDGERDIAYLLPYDYLESIDDGQEIYELIFPVIGSAAGVLAVFAALLLFSFISASINAKKKDIGILRAVGARGIDVFKIFIVEGIAVTLLCLVLGVAGSVAACAVTNGILISEGVLSYPFFLFGWQNALILFGIAAVTALVATGIPVAVFSRKKPVEAIRSI